VQNVRPGEGYDYIMLRSGLSGSLALEPQGQNLTRLRFRERFHMRTPLLRWFEGPIYRYINRKNEQSMRGAASWLASHPEFRPDLIERSRHLIAPGPSHKPRTCEPPRRWSSRPCSSPLPPTPET